MQGKEGRKNEKRERLEFKSLPLAGS